MRRAIIRAALVLLVAALAYGQKNEYSATCTGSLTASATACTLQIAASQGRWVLFKEAFIQTSVAAVLSQERDGTAASGSTGTTTRKRNPNASWALAPVAALYEASNVGAGTAMDPEAISISASPAYVVLDLRGVIFERSIASVQNYTIRLASMTGTYTISITWEERPDTVLRDIGWIHDRWARSEREG